MKNGEGMPFRNKWVGRGSSYCNKKKGVDDEFRFSRCSYLLFLALQSTVDSLAVKEWMLMRNDAVQEAGKYAGYISITSTERNVQRIAVTKAGAMVWRMKEFTAVHVNRKLILIIGNVIGSNGRTQ